MLLFTSLINNEGVAHLKYKISSLDDIIDRYSPSGFELLNPSFESYMAKVADYIPSKTPIVLEIIGVELNASEQVKIEDAIWNDYLLKISESRQKLKHTWIRIVWYVLCSLASAILIYISSLGQFSYVVTLLLYVPLWYFAYRVLSFAIFDCFPIPREIKRFKQLATLTLKFSLDASGELSHTECENAKATHDRYYSGINKDTRHAKIIDKYIMRDGGVDLEVNVSSMEDIIRSSSIRGSELICEGLSSYLSRAERFIKPNVPIRLAFCGYQFNDEEMQEVHRAIDNHKDILIKDAKVVVDNNTKKIVFFSICLLLAMVLLSVFGPLVDVSVHEMITIFFWFFADYLIEFVLLSNVDARKNLASAKSIQTAKISFSR